jgi:hypothetical protein
MKIRYITLIVSLLLLMTFSVYAQESTCWTSTEGFIDNFYGNVSDRNKRAIHPKNPEYTPWDTFRAMYQRMDELEKK